MRLPHKPAIIDENGSCTYAEFLERSRRTGSALAAARENEAARDSTSQEPEAMPWASGTSDGPYPVIVFMEKSAAMLVAFMGALMAGGFYVPVDPSVPVERAARIARTLSCNREAMNEHDSAQAAPRLLVVADASTRDAAARTFPHARILTIEELQRGPIDDEALRSRAHALVDSDPAYVLFTSGSTGTPKGVAVSHRAICGFIDGFVATFGIHERDVLGNQAPFDFDVSVKDIYGALATGATLALLPRRLFSMPAQLVEALHEHRVTVLIWAAAALCLVSSLHGLDIADLSHVRLVMFSGEVMPQKHLERWMERLPQATFVNLYGPTEVTCNCLYHVVDRERAYPQGLPLGRALPNRRVLVLDEAQRPLIGPGTGELYVGGPDIACGYYGDPKRTAAAFIPNPLAAALPETLYRTGDLVRVDEQGEVYFCGRADNQIKHQGHRIELEEIDAAFEAQAGVERCRCAYDARFKRIHAFYEGTADEPALRRAVARLLPLPMMPARIVRVECMPLTKNGKVDRAALLAGTRRAPSAVSATTDRPEKHESTTCRPEKRERQPA